MSRLIALTAPLPQGSSAARIVYGVGTGLDGFNYYDPNNTTTTFQPGETQIVLRQAVTADVTDVRILYGTDAVKMETRGAVARRADGTLDFTKVEPPNAWRIGRVQGVYAILEQPGVSTTGTITTQFGAIDTSDPLRMRVIPSQPQLIGLVQRVYDSSNRDYYGPVNPTNPFKPGDTVIKLDKSLPTGVFSVTIRYQGLSNSVTPSDPPRIHKVLGVYAVGEMTATKAADDTHIIPAQALSIRAVRAVYATANQSGAPDTVNPGSGPNDPPGTTRSVLPLRGSRL